MTIVTWNFKKNLIEETNKKCFNNSRQHVAIIGIVTIHKWLYLWSWEA